MNEKYDSSYTNHTIALRKESLDWLNRSTPGLQTPGIFWTLLIRVSPPTHPWTDIKKRVMFTFAYEWSKTADLTKLWVQLELQVRVDWLTRMMIISGLSPGVILVTFDPLDIMLDASVLYVLHADMLTLFCSCCFAVSAYVFSCYLSYQFHYFCSPKSHKSLRHQNE